MFGNLIVFDKRKSRLRMIKTESERVPRILEKDGRHGKKCVKMMNEKIDGSVRASVML